MDSTYRLQNNNLSAVGTKSGFDSLTRYPMKELNNQLNIKVIHRGVDLIVIRYNRYNGCDSFVNNAVAVYERAYSTIHDAWIWSKKYSNYPIELDAYDHSSLDYFKMQKLLTALYIARNSYTMKSH